MDTVLDAAQGGNISPASIGTSLAINAITEGVSSKTVKGQKGDEVGSSLRSLKDSTKGSRELGDYRPSRKLPRDKNGNPIPDADRPHMQLGSKKGRRETYTQAREWGYDSYRNLVVNRDIDFTDHGRPLEHHNPHQHNYVDNSTGGTRQRLGESELEMP
ncbi:hypothetical protein [Streptococcus ruminantium]|uniref:hypothetical protein n=1 Tax=Streptococcus ruminantium TaxID=1917441 RepID=UPI0012DD79F7|nr:hypothetical protein [Streptococcus ruminantium]